MTCDIKANFSITAMGGMTHFLSKAIFYGAVTEPSPRFQLFGNSRVYQEILVLKNLTTTLHAGRHFLSGDIDSLEVRANATLLMKRFKVDRFDLIGEGVTLVPEARPNAFPGGVIAEGMGLSAILNNFTSLSNCSIHITVDGALYSQMLIELVSPTSFLVQLNANSSIDVPEEIGVLYFKGDSHFLFDSQNQSLIKNGTFILPKEFTSSSSPSFFFQETDWELLSFTQKNALRLNLPPYSTNQSSGFDQCYRNQSCTVCLNANLSDPNLLLDSLTIRSVENDTEVNSGKQLCCILNDTSQASTQTVTRRYLVVDRGGLETISFANFTFAFDPNSPPSATPSTSPSSSTSGSSSVSTSSSSSNSPSGSTTASLSKTAPESRSVSISSSTEPSASSTGIPQPSLSSSGSSQQSQSETATSLESQTASITLQVSVVEASTSPTATKSPPISSFAQSITPEESPTPSPSLLASTSPSISASASLVVCSDCVSRNVTLSIPIDSRGRLQQVSLLSPLDRSIIGRVALDPGVAPGGSLEVVLEVGDFRQVGIWDLGGIGVNISIYDINGIPVRDLSVPMTICLDKELVGKVTLPMIS